MIAKIKSCGLFGIDGYIVDVEADVSKGLPAFDVVGLIRQLKNQENV